jgi:GNAT superfamily N-acetyltransferase
MQREIRWDAALPHRGTDRPPIEVSAMIELNVERAGTRDAPEILAIQKMAFGEEMKKYGDADIPPLHETVEQLEACIDRDVVVVAWRGGQIVGSVRMALDAGSYLVGRLVVPPDLWGQGIGTALLRAIEPYCAPGACLELFTGSNSHRSIQLYERVGYREVRREPAEGGYHLIYMQKRLPSA